MYIKKVYFRLFDYDEDGKINIRDLKKVFRYQVIKIIVDTNLMDEEIDEIAKKVMLEADPSEKEFLDYEDFIKILFSTNIDQKCRISFENFEPFNFSYS